MSVTIATMMAVAMLSSVAYGSFGPVVSLGSGTQPNCALGLNNTLHVVYVSGGQVQYRTMTGGVPSAAESIPNSDGAADPFVAVGTDGSVHVVWDTWSRSHYTNRIGGSWKAPQALPYTYAERNYFPQVAVASDGVAYTAHWSCQKDPAGGHNVFCRVTNTSSATPTITKIYQYVSISRPPSIIGPSPASAGTGNMHIFIGLPQTEHRTMDYNGNVSGATNISRTPYEKTAEGMHAFFIGSDPAICTGWFSGTEPVEGPLFNSLSRANASKQGLVVESVTGPIYPRAAYDPSGNKAYVIYPKAGKPALASWVPQQDSTTVIGFVSDSTISTGTRGCGAGGIARCVGGGVHIVYSTGMQVYYRSYGAAPDATPPSVPTNVQASPISWNSTSVMWTASTDNVGVAGYKIYRNGNPQPIGTSPTPGYTDTGLQPETTYSYRVSAYDEAQNESGQSSPPAVTVTLTRYALADFDQDGDVDLEDFGVLQQCYGILPVTGICIATDLNNDGAVNQTDFDIFRNCMSGANNPADPDCWNP